MPSPYERTSPEKRLLLACARAEIDSELAKKIRELLRYQLNWNLLLDEAHEHSVFPLLDRHLRAVAPELIPAPTVERLKTETRANVVRCLALSAELIRITEALTAAGISPLPYKGPAIASQAYGDITAREFEDLDLIVRQRDLEKANEIVCGLGYEARFPALHTRGNSASLVPGEYNYSNAERRTILELHTELTLRHFPQALELDEFFVRAVKIDLGGRALSTFAPEDALLFLAVHAAKDFWLKLIWVTDVAELIRRQTALNWVTLMLRARELRLQRMLHVNLLLARDLFETHLPMDVAASAQADATATLLAEWARDNFLAPAPKVASSQERFHLRRKMVHGTAAGWRYSMRLALAPAEDDWATVRLPRPLAPLYVLVRPFRLLRKYG